MKNKELFDRTVGILVKAYQENTLIPGEPCACAVGNIIAHNMGYGLILKEQSIKWELGVNNAEWYSLICLDADYLSKEKIEIINEEIISTGYSRHQLMLIEKAFESWENVKASTEVFDKLMNTIDCLMDIHEANQEETTQAKSLFIKETV